MPEASCTSTKRPQARRLVQSLLPYHAPEEGRAASVRLDFNETTLPVLPGLASIEAAVGSPLSVYPEYEQFQQQLAAYLNVSSDMLLLTNGSDEALSLLAQTFIEPGQDTAIISAPTFVMIPHYLTLAGANLLTVPVTDALTYDTVALEEALKQNIKMLILASPDNPTGAELPPNTLERCLQTYPETVFVLDEAYAEYTGNSVVSWVSKYPNLVVTRTFSKAWGLASLRLGYVVAQPDIIAMLSRVRSPYSVNQQAVQAGLQLLPHADVVMQRCQATMALKEKTLEMLAEAGYSAHKGAGNFFLLKLGIFASAFTAYMKRAGVLVRDRSNVPKLWGMVRVSIGTAEEMETFVALATAFRQAYGVLFDMDDTLVDTRESFPRVVQTLVERYSRSPLHLTDYYDLKKEGGYNDDWDTIVELLKRRGVVANRSEIASEALALYLELASSTEQLLVSESLLAKLSAIYPFAIATGRTREEYEPIWKAKIGRYFRHVQCVDDDAARLPKPSPDTLNACVQRLGLEGGVYVGNSIDDMRAAKAAGLLAVAVTTTQDAESLLAAGADWVMETTDNFDNALMGVLGL